MNILIPHSWLLEHLETTAEPAKIQELLSLSGPSVERIYDKDGESVYDIEVTTNRVDSMSVRGIAREAAVILNQAGIVSRLKPLELTTSTSAAQIELPLPRIENNPALCKRIMCVVLSTVAHTATPVEMGKRLVQIDQHIHDSVIDITNYITHELGHPCHAFDYDKIMNLGGVIRVVEATAGKEFTTLDGMTYKTVGGEVVFENEDGVIIDLPAIKGTANTAVDGTTKNVLFWIESIDHKKVRHGSMSHAIRTVAAQLNEKQVDPILAADVLARGIELYQELCQATVASAVYDDFPGKAQMPTVTTPKSIFMRYLGIELTPEKITGLLTQLGCTVTYDATTENFIITPPSFRPDIEIPADVVEEIARIYGYHNLPSTLMDTPIPTIKPATVNFSFEYACKRILADLGWQELYTYSLVSESVAKESGFSLEQHLKLQNPLTDDRVYLRRSLIPSLVEILEMNSEEKGLSIFEIANVYHPEATGLPQEDLHLTLVGQIPYREVRGVLEVLLGNFYCSNIEIVPQQASSTIGDVVYTVGSDKQILGTIQMLSKNRTAVDLLIARILPIIKTHPTYQALPKTAPVKEDLTFVLPEKTLVGPVISEIKATASLVEQVELVDQYKQNFSFTITYVDPEKPLSSVEVEPIRKQIVARVSEKCGGTLVGALK